MGQFVYKNQDSIQKIHTFYDKTMESLGFGFEESYLETAYGTTHVVFAGDRQKKPLFTLHGGNGITPLNIQLFKPLLQSHCLIAPDVIGMPGKSDPHRNLNIHKNDYAYWIREILNALRIEKVMAVVSSYSASMLLSLAKLFPERIAAAALLVPSGITHGPILPIIRSMAFPFMKYYSHPNPKALDGILATMCEETNDLWREFMDLMMSCYKMEMRPPKEYKRKELMSFSAPVLVIASADDVFFPAHKVFPAAEHLFGRSVSMLTITGKHLPSQRTMLEVCDEIEVFEKEVRGAE